MEIGIITLSTPNIEVYAGLTRANNLKYAERNQYRFKSYLDRIDMSRPASWSKLPALIENFSQNEWLMWIDADAMIMNHTIKIESIIDNDYDLILSDDSNGINCGVFLCKTTYFMLEIFNKIYSKIEFINHPWWEQAALMDELEINKELKSRTKIIGKKQINCYIHDFVAGDFILHLPGMSDQTRQAIFNTLKNEPDFIKLYCIEREKTQDKERVN